MTNDGASTGHGTGNLKAPWASGVSGNPRGGQVSLINLAHQVRRATKNGVEIVDLFVQIARGQLIEVPGGRRQRPNLDQRMEALRWLGDRGWGKAKEFLEVTSEASPEQRLALLRQLSDEDRDQLRTILGRALNPASEPVSDATKGDPALESRTAMEDPDPRDLSPVTG